MEKEFSQNEISKFGLIMIRPKEEVNRDLKPTEIPHEYAEYANIFKDQKESRTLPAHQE
jgi:hypothetical protein